MIKKIFKKFHIMLFIPIMMIACVFIFKEENDNSFLLEYHEPMNWIDPKIISHELYHINHARNFTANLITVNNSIRKTYALEKFQEQKRIEEEKKAKEEATKLSYNNYHYYSDTKYFTDEQQLRIPEGYTLDEIRMFCTMVYGECGAITGDVLITYYDENNNPENSFYIDASYMHKLTASVLYNRMKHKSFPDTIYGNLVKKNQYTELYTYESQSYSYYSGSSSNWYNVVNEVLEVLNDEFDIPDDVIFQSNFSNLGSRYFAKIYVDTGWFRSTSYYAYD
ncbi:MAG: hypothetical protein J6T10_32210 [Methanobrevibacter sp.]|nr:hypothetical protein [Methanobrevibacter sp.]